MGQLVWMGDIIVVGTMENGRLLPKGKFVVASGDLENLLNDSVTAFPIMSPDLRLPTGSWSNIHTSSKTYRASWINAQIIPKTAILTVVDKAVREDYIKLTVGKRKYVESFPNLS